MMKSLRRAVVLGALGGAVLACTVACTAGTTTSGPLEPQRQAQVTAPSSGVQISATISAVTLGDECAAAGAQAPGISADCAAPAADAGSGFAPGGSSKAAPGCGGTSYCQQSNVQIAFTAGAGTQSTRIEIVSVVLLDAATGAVVDTLSSSKPQAWSGNGYAFWDQTIKPAGELKASYDLAAPSWSKISGGTNAYSTKYKLQVTLRIDSVEVLLESTDLNREPQVAT